MTIELTDCEEEGITGSIVRLDLDTLRTLAFPSVPRKTEAIDLADFFPLVLDVCPTFPDYPLRGGKEASPSEELCAL